MSFNVVLKGIYCVCPDTFFAYPLNCKDHLHIETCPMKKEEFLKAHNRVYIWKEFIRTNFLYKEVVLGHGTVNYLPT